MGYAQRLDIDYDDTFATIAHMVTIKTPVALGGKKQSLVFEMDVKLAFLNWNLIYRVC